MLKQTILSTALTSLIIAVNLAPANADESPTNSTSLIPTLVTNVPTQANAGSLFPAVNQSTNRIYVPNILSGSVSVIDGKTNTLITNIPIDSSQGASGAYATGPSGIAINEEENILYVLTNNGTLSIVDGWTNKVKSSFVVDTVNNGPEGFSTPAIVFSQKTGKLYVSNTDIQIDVIDPRRQMVIARLADDTAYTLAIDQEKNLIYVNNLWDAQIAVIDGYTDQFTPTLITVGNPAVPTDCYKNFPVNPDACTSEGSHPDGIALDQEGHRLYVELNDGTAVVDTKHNTLLTTLPAVGGFAAAVDTETHAVYTIDSFGNLAVIDGNTDTVLANDIAVANGFNGDPSTWNLSQGIAVNSQTGRVYVADWATTAYGLGGPNQLVVLKVHHRVND